MDAMTWYELPRNWDRVFVLAGDSTIIRSLGMKPLRKKHLIRKPHQSSRPGLPLLSLEAGPRGSPSAVGLSVPVRAYYRNASEECQQNCGRIFEEEPVRARNRKEERRSMDVHLTELEWPEWGVPEERLPVARVEMEQRLEAAREAMRRLQLSHLLVYGDREHSANMLYLSGYDPRFEEALLLLGREGPARLLVGNEGLGYTGISPLPLEVELFQPFSLIGQDRSRGRSLPEVLRNAGMAAGQRVGTVGWKYELLPDGAVDRSWLELPAYLIETVRGLGAEPLNVADLLMHPGHGLRARCSPQEIAALEFAATRTSESVKRLI